MSAFDPKRTFRKLRGTLAEVGPHVDQKDNCRRAVQHYVTWFKVRLAVASFLHGPGLRTERRQWSFGSRQILDDNRKRCFIGEGYRLVSTNL